MSKERKEDISVEEDSLSVLLRTEQTTVKKEVFESIEQAIDRKKNKRWIYGGSSVVLTFGSAVSLAEGVFRLADAVSRGDSEEVAVGGGLIVLGSYLIYNMSRAVDAFELAKREGESLQTMLDRDIVDSMQDDNES